ncbi:hypothetical protein [Streptococcus halichoeri]|uniref:hypothetical protein n=1 Tax=Streptococcus halichoeri TaxID=254785 RepID=UPI001F2E5306|nr:hypothetical protein [Streptococcus halichoeri]
MRLDVFHNDYSLNKEHDKKVAAPFALLFLYTVVIIACSYQVITRQDSDLAFHMARIAGLAQSLRHGDFLPNLNFLFGNGVGYAVPMFYGQWLLYLPAGLFLLTKSITFAYVGYAFFLTLVSVYGTFIIFRTISHNQSLAFVLALYPPLVYANFGYGMTAATPLIPFLILAIYQIVFENRQAALLLGIVSALLIQTHIISTLVLAIMSLFFLALNYQYLNWQKLLECVKGGLLGLVLSIGFWLQLLEQTHSQVFYANWTTRPFMGMSGAARSFCEILQMFFDSNSSGISIAYHSPLIIFVTLLLLSQLVKWPRLSVQSKKLAALILGLLLMASSVFPWNQLKYSPLGVFQWPGRLLTFIPSLALLIFAIDNRSLKRAIQYFLIGFAMYMSMVVLRNQGAAVAYNHSMESQMKQAYAGANNIDGFSGMEYLTVDVDHHKANQKAALSQFQRQGRNYHLSKLKMAYNQLDFDISLDHAPATVQLPRIWYKGYRATYSQGAKGSQPALATVPLSKNEMSKRAKNHQPHHQQKVLNNGLAQIHVQRSGHVHISYQKTPLQQLGFGLEFLSWLLVILWGFQKSKD